MKDEIKLEVIRWHQKLQEIKYNEAGQHMRALNQLLWQVPSLVIAINGGLWYASTFAQESMLWVIFSMVGLFDIISIVTIFRLRKIIDSYIKKQQEIESLNNELLLRKLTIEVGLEECLVEGACGKENKKSKSNVVVVCWAICLSMCVIINIVGLINHKLIIKKDNENKFYSIKYDKNAKEVIINEGKKSE